MKSVNMDMESGRLDYQPLFGKRARAPLPNSGTYTGHERAAEIEPNIQGPTRVPF